MVDECRKQCAEMKRLDELNQTLFYYETMAYPMNPIDYSENKAAYNWYVRLLNKMELPLNQIERLLLYNHRQQNRESIISNLLMQKAGFYISTNITEFPEGHKYEKLYELYIKEEFAVKKLKIRNMISIVQKKWNLDFGLFPESKILNKYIETIDEFLNEH